MKTAIYIQDAVLQLVLTPETKWEENALDQLKDKELSVKFFRGEFSDCRGGYVKHFSEASVQSLMIRADVVPPPAS